MRLLSLIIAALTAFASFAVNPADSVNVRFSVGQRYFDPSLGDNREAMDAFISNVRAAAAEGDVERIIVRGYASPEGRPMANERLAANRCATIAAYIAAHAGVAPPLIEERPGGIGWAELRRLVAANPDVPRRSEVLDILDNTPVTVFDVQGRVVDSRKKQLMDLAGGRPWHWMMAHLYPELRNAVAISLCRVSDATPAADGYDGKAPEVAPDDSCDNSDSSDRSDASDSSDTSDSFGLIDLTDPTDSVVGSSASADLNGSSVPELGEGDAYKPDYRFALKTNLLYYAALMPNLELEWLINDRWSVALEANVAWWDRSYVKTYCVAYGSPEVRYHINPRDHWHGLYVGAFAGGGFFDLSGKKRGYRGGIAMAGLSVGYMWPITRRLSLEAAAGGGYMLLPRYKKYIPIDGHRVYQRTRTMNYAGPLKLKLSIVWRFGDLGNPGRQASTTTI